MPPPSPFNPDYRRRPNLDDVLAAHGSAAEALAAGNHYAALLMARRAGDRRTEAVALTLSGALERGRDMLAALDPTDETSEVLHFARWCLDETEEPPPCVTRWLGKSHFNLLTLHGPHTDGAVPKRSILGLEVRSASCHPDHRGATLAKMVGADFKPDAVVVFNAFGPQLPTDLWESGMPVIFHVTDGDFQLAWQYADLAHAHLIVVNSALEHHLLSRVYSSPAATYPVFSATGHVTGEPMPAREKSLDFLHTGLSYTPVMREKAQFLFHVAALDAPEARIEIHHGFLETGAYRRKLAEAAHVPNAGARLAGGLQSRVMDALTHGAVAVQPAGEAAALFVDGDVLVTPDLEELDERLRALVGAHRQPMPGAAAAEIRSLFPPPPARETRFLKFCLFMAARRAGSGVPSAVSARPGDAAHSLACGTARRHILALLANPLDAARRAGTLEALDTAVARFPDSLTLRFQRGRVRWTLEERDAAIADFDHAVAIHETGSFDPRREELWLELFKGPAELMPYQDYYLAAVADLAEGNEAAPAARKVIAATCLAYMALHALQANELGTGLARLDHALHLHADHFPALRLRFKALAAAGDMVRAANAFIAAVNAYPPFLTDLLGTGTAALDAAGRNDDAAAVVRAWAYFITRSHWHRDGGHPVPEDALDAALAHAKDFPESLRAALAAKFPGHLA